MDKVMTPNDCLTPRIVSLKELREKLQPAIQGWEWADDALTDLWQQGAPVPQASICPTVPPCPARACPHIKRILLPTQFSQWWAEVCQRTGSELSAQQALHLAKIR